MNVKNKMFFRIVIVGMIFLGFFYTYPKLAFYGKSEFINQNFISEILSNSDFERIHSFNVSKSEDERFMAMTGTLIKNDEKLNYIVVFNKLPFIDHYHLAFDSIYNGESVKTNECIMEITDDVIKTPFLKYNLAVYNDVILVKSQINIYFIATFLLIFFVLTLGRKIRKELY